AILADAFEALLGAIFLDAGFEAAAAVIERLFGDRLVAQLTAPRDPKTELQEWAQARRLPLPKYREVSREGPVHEPVFVVEVTVKGQEPAQGRGGAKREAERLAAAAALERLAGI
ncbi:MAG TPA: putative dsRNA-binding protein, partial [Reyranella sp.]|nr:putative dsRNA-binding protein [Reyranella sp.]